MTYLDNALKAIQIELDSIIELRSRLDNSFNQACELLMNCSGRVIIIGMGKSGHIGSKIAATFSSTGTPAYFVHPAEAGHGDFGMITKNDIIIAISNSGSTNELIQLLPQIKALKIPMISFTGKTDSILAKNSTITLDISVKNEACPHNLAPTSSTTVSLVLGDAIAIALLKAKNITKEDFAFSHPSGSLGKRLLVSVSDLMSSGENIPTVYLGDSLEKAILEISTKKLGITTVVNSNGLLKGVITDGDLRRLFQSESYSSKIKIDSIYSKAPKTIFDDELAINALNKMEQYKISTLVVVSRESVLVGVIHLHHLLQSGIL